jgi:hypothetical protein
LGAITPELVAQEFRKERVRIELLFHKPATAAVLTIAVSDFEDNFELAGIFSPDDPSNFHLKKATSIKFEFSADQSKYVSTGDRRDTTSIGYPTLRAVAELLRE